MGDKTGGAAEEMVPGRRISRTHAARINRARAAIDAVLFDITVPRCVAIESVQELGEAVCAIARHHREGGGALRLADAAGRK